MSPRPWRGTAVLNLAIAAFTVTVMKGPAYVAGTYPMNDAEMPRFGSRV